MAGQDKGAVFTKPEEQKVAQIAWDVIRKTGEPASEAAERDPPARSRRFRPPSCKAVEEQYRPVQMELEGITEKPDIAAVVAKTAELVNQETINIPRILVVPKGEVKSGFRPFTLKLDSLNYPAVSDELWIQHLRTNQLEVLALGRGGLEEARLEDYVVSGLVDFDDISYDEHADLLYDLAGQMVQHFRTYLSEEDTRKVLRCYQKDIAQVHPRADAGALLGRGGRL